MSAITITKLTQLEVREYDKRLKLITEMLARSPYLTKSHFTNHYGCRHAFLKLLEDEHGVKFGKGERSKLSYARGSPCSRT